MLCYDTIDISEGIYLAKSNNSKECMICHYLFFNHGFEFHDSIYMLSVMLSVNISCISVIKSVTIDLLKNYVLEGRGYI